MPAVAHRPFDESPPFGVLAPAEGGGHPNDPAAARARERHFAAVAQSAADAIVSIDAAGSVTFYNQAAQRAFGYTPEEVTVVRRADPPELEGQAAGGERTVELRGRRKGGSELPVEAAFSTSR